MKLSAEQIKIAKEFHAKNNPDYTYTIKETTIKTKEAISKMSEKVISIAKQAQKINTNKQKEVKKTTMVTTPSPYLKTKKQKTKKKNTLYSNPLVSKIGKSKGALLFVKIFYASIALVVVVGIVNWISGH